MVCKFSVYRHRWSTSICIWATSWANLIIPYANNKGAVQSEQRLCCSLPSQYNISNFYIRNFKPLASLCSWTGRFQSYLVANPKTGFLVTGLIVKKVLNSIMSHPMKSCIISHKPKPKKKQKQKKTKTKKNNTKTKTKIITLDQIPWYVAWYVVWYVVYLIKHNLLQFVYYVLLVHITDVTRFFIS